MFDNGVKWKNFYVFLIIEMGIIVGDIPSYEKVLNYIKNCEEIKIFNEVRRILKKL